MSILKPSGLPLELIEKIIDEVFYSQVSYDTRYQRIMVDPETLSSLAHVSHIFRQRINAHRFSIVSFQEKNDAMSLRYIHAFLDLLRSDVWVTPNMGIARHVRKLMLILGEITQGGRGTVPHLATEDGSLTTILNTVFRGGEGYPYPASDYTLALMGGEWRWLSWETINPDFVSNIESLLDSRIATLELTLLEDVPPTLMRRRHVKRLSISATSFQVTPQHISDFRALGPWRHLENLKINNTPFFDLVNREDIPMLNALTVTIFHESMANALFFDGRHWNVLEVLTLNLDNTHIMPEFRVDYRNFANLTRLTLNFSLVHHNSSSTASSNAATHQILNLLGPHLPPLARLEIWIDTHLHAVSRALHTQRATDILAQIDCTTLDTVLVQYSPSAVSMLALRFGIKLSRGGNSKDYLALETFRQDGLAVLREAFPLLNASLRRAVYDSEVMTRSEDQEKTLLYWGMFSVAYIAGS